MASVCISRHEQVSQLGSQEGFGGAAAGKVLVADGVSHYFLGRFPGVELLGQRAVVIV